MIVSPPFIPDPQANETDAQFIMRAMQGGTAGDGGFPVSYDLNWHGGIHLEAPPVAATGRAPVRAIADGTVAFVRQPTAHSADPKHPLNYRGGWTDDGCVIIRHETTIGAHATTGQETSAVYYSLCMHLSSIDAAVQQGHAIYRKTPLGRAGSIYGVDNRIHCELICDDTNLEHIVGRARNETYLAVDRDGRTDAVFGTMWFLLLVNTPFYAARPVAGQPLSAPAFTNDVAIFVGTRLEGGACKTQSRSIGGSPIGNELDVADYEYNLFSTATTDYPLCPAAGYELLRYGRVLGPDALQPAAAPRWHEVRYPGGKGWVNLNDPRVRKFSDADMPFWDDWWTLVDGSTCKNSRCDDTQILDLLDRDNNWKVPRAEAQQSLNDPDRQRRLAKKFCKFRTEWDGAELDQRYGWLQTDPEARMSADDFARFKAHVTALSFWQQANIGIDSTHWHMHPRSFVAHFRKCGWFNLNELTQLMPRRPTGRQPRRPGQGEIAWATAQRRFRGRLLELNRVLRKYNMLDAKRQTQFLAQTYIETGLWDTMREYNHARPNANGTWAAPAMQYYAAFYGRGIMQLTWAGNYEGYGSYRRRPNIGPSTAYQDTRITHTSTHYWWDPRNRAGVVVQAPRVWFARFDPEFVADDAYAACDSGGYYWVSKNTGHGQLNINRVADRAFGTASVARASVLVNGGGYGFVERQRWAAYINRYRGESTESNLSDTFTAANGNTNHTVVVDYTPQRP